MASEKVTIMILNVDLKCPCYYKKVRKLLCKFPQIRDQVFEVDKNRVVIKVVCCDPERIRDKLCCKGGKSIQSIEIVENKPKPPPEKPAPVPVEKPKVDPPKPDPPKPDSPKSEPAPAPPPPKSEPAPAPPPPVVLPQPEPIHGYPPPFFPPQFPVSACCQECYEGRDGGPCHYGYGRPVPPPPPGPCYEGYGYQYGGNRPCYVRCDYFSEENPQGCSIM